MRSEKISFDGTQGALAARLDLPNGKPKAYALFAHCFTCSKDIFAATRIASGLADLGIATLRFDFTGLGASEGDFANSNFSSNIQDLLKAAAYMKEAYEAPAILIGHSLGGAAILAAAGDIPNARALVTIGAPSDPEHIKHHFDDRLDDIRENGEAGIVIAGRNFRVKQQFIEDIEGRNLANKVKKLKRPLLILHSPIDNIVGIENAGDIFVAAMHPKSFVTLDQADHLLSRREDAIYVANIIATWAERYVETLAPPQMKSRFKPGPDRTIVSETDASAFTQSVNSAGHSLIADEPLSFGGSNLGPSPYDLLLAGLGACTSMTIRMYARHKNIPLTHVAVQLQHSKVHARDCEDCENKDGKIDAITREVSLEGNLTSEQRERLLEIANKCPVHRTLQSKIRITTSLKDE